MSKMGTLFEQTKPSLLLSDKSWANTCLRSGAEKKAAIEEDSRGEKDGTVAAPSNRKRGEKG